MKIRHLVFLGYSLFFSFLSATESEIHEDSRPRHECELSGYYAYQLSGPVGIGLTGFFSEAGAIFFDGRDTGHLRGRATLNGNLVISTSAEFTYIWLSKRLALATISADHPTIPGAQFAIGVGENADTISLQFYPYPVPGNPFAVNSVSGIGGR